MQREDYIDFRKNLINNYNISLIQHIVNIFTNDFKQELEALEKWRCTKFEEKVIDVKAFCQTFYGISSLDCVNLYFKSGLKISLTKDVKLFGLRYDNNYTRTSKIGKIADFLKKNNLA